MSTADPLVSLPSLGRSVVIAIALADGLLGTGVLAAATMLLHLLVWREERQP